MSLYDLFLAWQLLPAFRHVDWSRTTLSVRSRKPSRDMHKATGLATLLDDDSNEIIVRVGYDFIDAMTTLLHEMAHCAAWPSGQNVHWREWRAVYANACENITECYPLQNTQRGLDDAVRELMRRNRRAT